MSRISPSFPGFIFSKIVKISGVKIPIFYIPLIVDLDDLLAARPRRSDTRARMAARSRSSDARYGQRRGATFQHAVAIVRSRTQSMPVIGKRDANAFHTQDCFEKPIA